VSGARIEEWFGRQVWIELAQFGNQIAYRFSATLESANSLGLVTSYQNEGNPYRQHLFFPWQQVRHIALVNMPGKDGQERDRTESQPDSEMHGRSPRGVGNRGHRETPLRREVTTKPEFHPDAAKSFNEKAQALLSKVAPATEHDPSAPTTHLGRPGAHAHEYSEEDFIEFKITGLEDSFGRVSARYFEHEGQSYGFEDEEYEELAHLSEGVQRTIGLRDIVSINWVEDTILDWMKNKCEDADIPELSDFLIERCEEEVKKHEFWFPVSQLSIESDLPFGNVVFKSISKDMLDRLEEDLQKNKEGRDEEYAAQLDHSIERKRHDLQGLAAATITVNAEPKRAREVALRESERAINALGIFHIAATTMPEVTSYCAVLGKENIEEINGIKVENGRIRGEYQQGTEMPILNWHLSNEEISELKKLGFDNVSDLLTLERRTAFQEALLDALLLYSRSTREKDLAGRLVYMLVAIESMLVRNENEPIQQNVGERVAFLIAEGLEERQAKIRNLKAAYALRSKFVHHGRTIDDVETVRVFMLDAWSLFLELAKASYQYETMEQLFDHLDVMKLS